MNSSHVSQVSRGTWLQRLAIAAAGFLVATLATAGTVTIVGGSNPGTCVYTSVTGDANNITFNCGTAQANGPGTVTLTAPATIVVGGSGVNATATRTLGQNTDISVDYAFTGAGCAGPGGTLNWTGSDNSARNILVTSAAAGSCSVSLSAGIGSPAIVGSPKSITVVSADDPVAFDFDVATINNTSFGAPATTIKIKRTGGSNGSYAVNLTYGGFLAAPVTAGTLGVANAAAGSTPAVLQFPANSTEASVTFLPVSSVPVGFPPLPTPGSVTITSATHLDALGSALPAILPAANQRTFNLVAVTGCPVLSNVVMLNLGPVNKGVSNSIARGQIASFAMPSPMATGGYVQMVQDPGTPVSTDVEIWFSSCPGDANDPLRNQTFVNQWGGVGGKPCVKTYGKEGGPVYWNKNGASSTVCKLADIGGPYYVNYRHNTCVNATCPMIIQYNNTQ